MNIKIPLCVVFLFLLEPSWSTWWHYHIHSLRPRRPHLSIFPCPPVPLSGVLRSSRPWHQRPGFCFCGFNKVCSQFHAVSQLGIRNIWGINCTFIDHVQIMFPYHCPPTKPCNAHMIFTFGIRSNLQEIHSIQEGVHGFCVNNLFT